MPTYVFECKCGATWTEIRPIAKRNKRSLCRCGEPGTRVIAPGNTVNQDWNPNWKFPNLNPEPNQDWRSFKTRDEYEKTLKDLGAAEKSLGIREV